MENFQSQRQIRQKEIEEIFDGFSELAKKLCFYDWMYINDLYPNDILEIRRLLEIGDRIQIDSFFLHHYETNLNSYKCKLIDLNPIRENIIIEIFEGINSKLYYLAIPAMISQIEGITEEKTGIRFFGTSKGNTKLKKYVDTNNLKYFNKFLAHPVDTIWEYSRNQNHEIPSGLNRHDIVHGSSIDYGSRINCYKYLSLFLFISVNINDLKQNK